MASNERSQRPQPLLRIRVRHASRAEAEGIERALERLLIEWVDQERAEGSFRHERNEQHEQR